MSCVAGAYTNGSGAFDMHGTHSPITLHMQGWRRGRVSREAEAPRPVQEPAHADSVRRGSSSKRLQVRLQHIGAERHVRIDQTDHPRMLQGTPRDQSPSRVELCGDSTIHG